MRSDNSAFLGSIFLCSTAIVCSSLWTAGISKLSHAHIIGKYSFGAVATSPRLTIAEAHGGCEMHTVCTGDNTLPYNKGLRFPID